MEGIEGEIIVLCIPNMMEYLRGLVGGGNFRSWREGEEIYLEMCYGEERFCVWGLDREEVFLRILREVGEWYWEECRPSFGNINFRDIMLGGDIVNSGVINFGVEIREVGGEVEIVFEDYWAAKAFMGRWNRFILSEEGKSFVVGETYHGRMLMLEGEVVIISSGGEDRMPPAMWGGYSSNYGSGYGVGSKVSSVYGGGGAVGIPNGGGIDVEVGFGDLEDMIGVS